MCPSGLESGRGSLAGGRAGEETAPWGLQLGNPEKEQSNSCGFVPWPRPNKCLSQLLSVLLNCFLIRQVFTKENQKFCLPGLPDRASGGSFPILFSS